MNLPHASNQMSEKGLELSYTAGYSSVAQSTVTAHQSTASSNPPLDTPAPVAVLMLDRAGCIKTFNCTAQALFGEAALGQSWPLLRNASFSTRHGCSLLTSRSGTCYVEQYSSNAKDGERIICLQSASAANTNQSLVALGEGVARLVHQVRTPLTAAALYLDQLSRQLGHEPKLQRLARKPAAQLRCAESVIDGALGLIRPVSRSLQTIDVSDTLRALEAQCGVVVMSLGAHLYCAPLTPGVFIKADAVALLSALSNLVINAAQHPVKGRLLRVCVVARLLGDHVVFEISDTGKGVSETEKQKIFNAFESTRSEGTGLGLSVAQRVLGQFDGKIEVSNNAEGGATFSVRFPAEAIDVAA